MAVVLGSLALLLVGTGVSWAAWTANGSGTAAARAITATASVATATTPGAALYPKPASGVYPSSAPGTVTFTLDNPNPYAVVFTAMTVGVVTPSNTATCPVLVTPGGAPTVTGSASPVVVSIALPANAPPTAQTVPGVLVMDGNAANGCQGQTFTAAVTLTGASNPAA